jgi:esterase/lipase
MEVQNKKQAAQIAVLSDVEKQLEQTVAAGKKLEKQNTVLQKELVGQSEYISALEEKMYKANVTSLELLKQLKDAEQEIETLKSYIIDLKSKVAVYIPVKDDPIDEKLADFINNYPDRQRLKIMFMRESEGVYEFGSKKIFIKVEKDKIKSKLTLLAFHADVF